MTKLKNAFPKDFLWGTATAAHQVEGNCSNNNWYLWESTPRTHQLDFIGNKVSAGKACDHWNQFRADIKLMVDLGVNAYRFSVEWSKIEPEQGVFNQEALNHYSEVIDCLIAADITPMITLHHFTHPIWFEKLGAFENEENNSHFVSFSERVFKEYSERVQYWCTINEPAVFTVHGYFTGIFPPEKRSLKFTTRVLKNLLLAHVQVYQKLKSLPNGTKVQIGLVKNITQFKPWRKGHPLDRFLSWISNHVFNDAIINCLKTGRFRIKLAPFTYHNSKIKSAESSYDFIGLNYYSHNFLKFTFNSNAFELKFPEDEIITDMPYTIFPQGFYDALQVIAELGKPIIVTENGIADAKDDRRQLWITSYLEQLERALADGLDIRGYFYWSLMDNYEWAEGYRMKFGLYEVDFKTQDRKLRKSAEAYQNFINIQW